jgi:hypothetical protein
MEKVYIAARMFYIRGYETAKAFYFDTEKVYIHAKQSTFLMKKT